MRERFWYLRQTLFNGRFAPKDCGHPKIGVWGPLHECLRCGDSVLYLDEVDSWDIESFRRTRRVLENLGLEEPGKA